MCDIIFNHIKKFKNMRFYDYLSHEKYMYDLIKKIINMPLPLEYKNIIQDSNLIKFKINLNTVHLPPEIIEKIMNEYHKTKIQKYIIQCINESGNVIEKIPNHLITKELCTLAVSKNGVSIQCIPDLYRSEELYELAVSINGFAITYIPKNLINSDLCLKAIRQDYTSMICIPDEFKTYDLILEYWKIAYTTGHYNYVDIPDNYRMNIPQI